MLTINSNEDFNKEIINSKGSRVILFSANWCYKCKILEPMCEKFSNDFKFYKINIDEHKDICKEYGVMSIPTLIIFKDGIEINRNIGLLDEDKLKEFLKI